MVPSDTELKKTQHLVNQAFAAKEQMLAIVSHDIKNPLSAIQLEAQMLMRVVERHGKSMLAEEVKMQASRILKTTERLKLLITDLLDKNKTENGLAVLNKSEVDVSALIHEVLESLRPHLCEKKLTLTSHLPDKTLSLRIDRNKMFQVLMNLFSNALKFTPSEGRIHFEIEERDKDCRISISDSGPGLKPEHLPHIFDKYWTNKLAGQSGTGLGLFICKTIVEAHGGDIQAENLPQGGACFSFRLPKDSYDLKEAKLLEGEKRVLVIDDDEDLREVIDWTLSKEGFSVITYADPMKALDDLHAGKLEPQLILADYQMQGMKGGEFLRLKSDLPAVHACPVLMVSAAPKEVEQEIPGQLYKEIITKPLDLEGLVERLKTYLS